MTDDELSQEIRTGLRDQATGLAALESTVANVKEGLDNLFRIIKDGNGKPGLVTQVALVKQDVDQLKEDRKKGTMVQHAAGQTANRKAQLAIWTALGAGVFGFIMALIKHFSC